MLRKLCVACLIFAGATLPAAHASKVKVWNHYNQGHYDKAELKGTVVSSEGTLRLSRALRPLASIDATHVWDVVEDKAGNLIVATGDEGKLFKVTPDGKASVIYVSPDSQILSLAVAADGTVFAGTGPSGTVVAIPHQGKAKIFADDLDQYVWSLVYDPETRSLFAGTGPKGRIYRMSPEGKTSVFYTTRQEHVLCLALGANKTLFAGTDKGGLVYRIDPKGKGFVLYHAHQAEVRSLLVTADGGVYAGTSSPVRKRSGGGSAATRSSSDNAGDAGQTRGLPGGVKPDKGAISAQPASLNRSA